MTGGYKGKVLNTFPKSKCERDGVLFFVQSQGEDLGAGFSKEAAWQSAFITIQKNNMITVLLAKFETRVNDFPVSLTLEFSDLDGFNVVYGSKGNMLYWCRNADISKAFRGYKTIRKRYRQRGIGYTETLTDFYFSPEKIQP